MEAYNPITAALPFVQVLTIMVERQKREHKRELWRRYMANLIPMWGGKDVKTFDNVLVDYERALMPRATRERETKAAYDVAENVIRRLEQARRG